MQARSAAANNDLIFTPVTLPRKWLQAKHLPAVAPWAGNQSANGSTWSSVDAGDAQEYAGTEPPAEITTRRGSRVIPKGGRRWNRQAPRRSSAAPLSSNATPAFGRQLVCCESVQAWGGMP